MPEISGAELGCLYSFGVSRHDLSIMIPAGKYTDVCYDLMDTVLLANTRLLLEGLLPDRFEAHGPV